MLSDLDISDTPDNESKLFVKVKIFPQNNDWWADLCMWKVEVNQSVSPEWFKKNGYVYGQKLVESLSAWKKEHILENTNIDVLSEGYYFLKNCKVNEIKNDTKVVLRDSTVIMAKDGSTIVEAYGKSVIKVMTDKSSIISAHGDTIIERMCDNSKIEEMSGNSKVVLAYGDASIQNMYGNSSVDVLTETSFVEVMTGNTVINKMKGNAVVWERYENSAIKMTNDMQAIFKQMNRYLGYLQSKQD